MGDFVIWGSGYSQGSCVIENPEGFDDEFMLNEGVSLLEQWPERVVCRMDSEFPKDIKLTDNLYGANFPVVSQRIRDAAVALAATSQIEFLPVVILNHKGRVASKDYFIFNPLQTIDCIDVEKSGVTWNSINPDSISRVKQLALRDGSVPGKVDVFRPAHLQRKILLRRSLYEKLSDYGITGLSIEEPEKFRG